MCLPKGLCNLGRGGGEGAIGTYQARDEFQIGTVIQSTKVSF